MQWLFWQMANLGPKAGEANHFRHYAPEKTAICDRSLHQRDQPHLRRDEHAAEAARISRRQIFDRRHGLHRLGHALFERQGQTSTTFPHLKRWIDACWRGRRSSAACTCGSRKRARSICRIPRCAPYCSASARVERWLAARQHRRLASSDRRPRIQHLPGFAGLTRRFIVASTTINSPVIHRDD